MRKSRSTPLIKLEYIDATRISKLHPVHPKEYEYTDKVNKGQRKKKVEKVSDCRYVNEGHYLDRKVFRKMCIETQTEEYFKNYYKNRRNGTSQYQQLLTCQIKKHHESIKKTNCKIERHNAFSNLMKCNVTEAYFMVTNRDDIDQERSKNRKYYPRMNTVQVASSFNPVFIIGEPPSEIMMKADKDLKGDSFFKCCKFYFCHRECNKKKRQSKTKPTEIRETLEQTKKGDMNFKKTYFRKRKLVNKNVKIPNVPDDSTLKCESQQNKDSLLHRCFRLISRKDKQKPLKNKVIIEYNELEKSKTRKKRKFIKLCFTFRTGKKDSIKLKKSKSIISLSQTQELKKSFSIKRPTLQRPSSTNLVKSQSHTSSINIYTANYNEKITTKSTSRTTVINVEKLPKNGTLSETFQVRPGLKFEVRPSKPQVGRVCSSLKLILKFKKNILSFFSRKRKKGTKVNKYVDRKAKNAESMKKRKENCIEMPSKSAIQKKSPNENQNKINTYTSDSKINTSKRRIYRTDSKTIRTKSWTDSTYKRESRPFDYESRLSVSGICDPYDCSKRIESKELYVLISTKSQNKGSQSQTDVIKTNRKAIQTQANRKNYKNTSLIFETHLSTTCRLINENKNVRHNIMDLNTKHERTLQSFKCDTGYYVPGIRDDCLKITYFKSIQNTNTKPHTREIPSNNKLHTEYRLQINGSNQNDVPNFKDQCRIRTVERKRQIDTRTYTKLRTKRSQPNTTNSHNDITNLKTNIMLKQQPYKCKLIFTASKQCPVRTGIQKCNSDSGRKCIRTIKTSESDNCHYAVVCSRGHKKNLIFKRYFKYGITHKEKHGYIYSQTNETNHCSLYYNNNITHNNSNKKSESDNDFMWAQKAKKEPPT